MTPPRARTWGRRGHTLVIRVRGRSRRRTSVAALCCYKPGEKSRLIHRPRTHLLLKGARKSSSYKDHRADRGPGRYGRPGPRSAGVGIRSVFFSRGTMVKRRVW